MTRAGIDERRRAVHVLHARFETYGLVPAIAQVALAGGVLVIREAGRDIDIDATDGVDSLLECVEVDSHEVGDANAEDVGEHRVGHGRAGIHSARRLGPLTEHSGRIREVDSLLSRFAIAKRDVHEPVAWDGYLGDLRWEALQ